MADPNEAAGAKSHLKPVEQPTELVNLLAALNTARKQANMYGAEHPNSLAGLAHVDECMRELGSSYDRATCVFTHEAVILNQHYYKASRDSIDMCERLRARGAMAITFIGAAPPEQMRELLSFLNTEPREVRGTGGPSDYLRRRGVSRIVLTESIYASGEGDEEEETDERSQWDGASEDTVIAAAIDWLSKQEDDENDEPPPKLPIVSILSTPDSAAKLIREAVTKLHASRRDMSHGECVTEAINDLKSIASDTPEEWDSAASQIRKAIAKLPQNLHPSSTGFESGEEKSARTAPKRYASIEDAEMLVSEVMREIHVSKDRGELPPPSVFDEFFGVQAPGLLTSWKQELQPTSVLESTGRTLDVLMTWETNAGEHGRIANALASLIPRAVEVNDTRSALGFTEWLLNSALQDTEYGWRRTNVKGALDALETEVLVALVRSLLEMGRSRSEEAVTALLIVVPSLSLELLDMLGTASASAITPYLRKAVLGLGQAAQPALARVLSEGNAEAKIEAIGILAETSRSWAAEEIIRAMKENDLEFTLAALEALPKIRIPLVTQTCIGMLSHEELTVRCAAIKALGELRDSSAIPQLAKIATRNGLINSDQDEQITALNALGRLGGEEALQCLKSIAKRRPLIGRFRFETIRRSAQNLVEQLESRERALTKKAA